ncbi:MAG: hypothetical protein ACTSQF_05570 [Candidatus Heimdallarchaeaceae archaeon]
MASVRVRIHRIISWMLVGFFFATVFTGYSQTQNWFVDQFLLSKLHRIFEWLFIALLVYHLIYTIIRVKIKTRKLISKIQQKKGTYVNSLRLIQKFSSWLIVGSIFFIILSGLNGYVWFADTFGTIIPFSWHRQLDLVMNISILIHIAIGLKFFLMRRKVRKKIIDIAIFSATAVLIAGAIYLQIPKNQPPLVTPEGDVPIEVNGITYKFNPANIISTRPELFQEGSFSLFDILAHLESTNFLNMEYHFDSLKNTHIIDSIDGESGYWYQAYYSGGWWETNVYRMDHYPWKEQTTFRVFQEDASFLHSVYAIFEDEVSTRISNGGNLIIPTVNIHSNTFSETFSDVLVTAHNLRNDTFQLGVTTAIDVIMSLGDQGLITYELEWYDSIYDAEVVRSYWVDGINNDTASGTCGYVYESGYWTYQRFAGNHIHIPQDFRILNSPLYYETFWICL